MRARLLDRDAELRALTQQVAAVRARTGRVIAVDGPAGIGKTSLLAAVADSAEADGVAVSRRWLSWFSLQCEGGQAVRMWLASL